MHNFKAISYEFNFLSVINNVPLCFHNTLLFISQKFSSNFLFNDTTENKKLNKKVAMRQNKSMWIEDTKIFHVLTVRKFINNYLRNPPANGSHRVSLLIHTVKKKNNKNSLPKMKTTLFHRVLQFMYNIHQILYNGTLYTTHIRMRY